MGIISFIDQAEVIIHAKRNSLAHELPFYETQLMRRLIACWRVFLLWERNGATHQLWASLT